LFLFCSLLPEFVDVSHGSPFGRLRAAYSYPDPSRLSLKTITTERDGLG
jgi:hypothetical protein